MSEFNISFSRQNKLNISFEDDSGFELGGIGSITEVVDNDYNKLTNKPTINAVTVEGAKVGDDYQLQNKLTAGENITLTGTVISAEFEQDFATYSEVLAYLNS